MQGLGVQLAADAVLESKNHRVGFSLPELLLRIAAQLADRAQLVPLARAKKAASYLALAAARLASPDATLDGVPEVRAGVHSLP